MKEYQLQYLSVDTGRWEVFQQMSNFNLAIDKFNEAVKSDPGIPHRIILCIEMMSYHVHMEEIDSGT